MTRGQFVVITNDSVINSCEFNGDMYYDCYGKEVIERLARVKTIDDLLKEVKDFNNKNFQYDESDAFIFNNKGTDIDFSKDYIGDWFSDYLYVKNISDEIKVIKDANGKPRVIEKDEIRIFYFGEPHEIPVEK